LGTPTEELWPGLKAVPSYIDFPPSPAVPFANIFSAASDDMLALIAEMFKFGPTSRCTAAVALKHKYFSNPPAPTIPSKMPVPQKTPPAETFARPVVPNKRKNTGTYFLFSFIAFCQIILDMENSSARKKLELTSQ
jgi:serine/threonine protein kinase